MEKHLKTKGKNVLIGILMVALLVVCSIQIVNASTQTATAKVDAKYGAYLRKSTSTSSKKIKLLKNNSKMRIYKEIFTSKTSTKSTKKWYYVKTSSGKKGYIRSDCVDTIKYTGGVKMQVKPGTGSLYYRAGAGTKMKSKGFLYDYDTTTAVLKSYQKGSSTVWYKIKKGSSYYYSCGTFLSTNIKKNLIPDFSGSTASQINQMAQYLSWDVGTASSKYAWSGGKPTEEYKYVHSQWPRRTTSNSYDGAPKAGASCDRFVGCVVWAVTGDTNYPNGSGFKSSQQGGYMADHPEKWTEVKNYKGDTSVLRAGDVITYTKDSTTHILIMVKVDGKLAIAEAALKKSYPHINTSLTKIQSSKIKTYSKVAVYRPR